MPHLRGSVPSITLASVLSTGVASVALAQGGEDAGTAVPLALDVITTGTTLGFSDDSDEVCPYTGSTSPDVYYRYVPTSDHNLTVELCESGYDTKTYVYDSGLALIADFEGELSCNDDACTSSGGGSFRSLLHCVRVTAGLTFYVVVDGWSGDSGGYTIELHDTRVFTGDPLDCQRGPCIIECDPAHTPENEPCDLGGPDVTNGGCNSSPPIFSPIACGETYCGEVWFDGVTRDTDWYEIVTTRYCRFTWEVVSAFEGAIGSYAKTACYNGDGDCGGVICFVDPIVTEPCIPAAEIGGTVLPPGQWWFIVSPNFGDLIGCEPGDAALSRRYVATLECECLENPCPADLDGNGHVGFADLLAMLADWGPCAGCPSDITLDGQVAFGDLLILLGTWGPCK